MAIPSNDWHGADAPNLLHPFAPPWKKTAGVSLLAVLLVTRRVTCCYSSCYLTTFYSDLAPNALPLLTSLRYCVALLQSRSWHVGDIAKMMERF